MTQRELVLNALNFKPVPRTPRDLAGMNSTGISCFAHPPLRKALGLPPRRPRIHDTNQMLALPELDMLDALNVDVVTVHMDWCTNAFDEPGRWHDFDMGGRVEAQVMNPDAYDVEVDGTVVLNGHARMVPGSYVFDSPHGGQPLNLTGEIPKQDLDDVRERALASVYDDAKVESVASYCRRVRESTDRAVVMNGLRAGLGYPGGMANFSILCLTEPDYVHQLHEIVIEAAIARVRKLLPAIAPYVDVIMFSADDQGTQSSTILPPRTFRELFVPYYQRVIQIMHEIAPDVKVFLHSCGAIYDIIDDIVDCGFDVLNPVQWSAGGHSYREWKDKCRDRIALWGGGVNTQTTLPLGTVDDVRKEASEVARYLAEDSGYVFCAIHNILAEIEPEKVIALYQSVP